MNVSIVLIAISIFLVALVSTVFYWAEKNRPKGRIDAFKMRYTPTVWTPEQLNYAILVFHRMWLEEFPDQKRKINKIFNQLNIIWADNRWRKNGTIAAAEVLSPVRLKIWRGPKVRGNRYKMSYTALPEGLVQLIVYRLEGKVLDANTVSRQYKQFLRDVREQLQGQVGNGKRSLQE